METNQSLNCETSNIGLDRYIGWPIYLADTNFDTDISVSVNWILVLAISVWASVSPNLDISYIGIGKISMKNMDIGQNIG